MLVFGGSRHLDKSAKETPQKSTVSEKFFKETWSGGHIASATLKSEISKIKSPDTFKAEAATFLSKDSVNKMSQLVGNRAEKFSEILTALIDKGKELNGTDSDITEKLKALASYMEATPKDKPALLARIQSWHEPASQSGPPTPQFAVAPDSPTQASPAKRASEAAPSVEVPVHVEKKPLVAVFTSEGSRGFEDTMLDTFATLANEDPRKDTTESLKPSNTPKNRYRNIRPYDGNRVKLTLTAAQKAAGKTDYINASRISGKTAFNRSAQVVAATGSEKMKQNLAVVKQHSLIAPQGPTPTTVADFIQTIYQEGVQDIFMVTNLEEKGKAKCERYYPSAADTNGEKIINDEHGKPAFKLKLISEALVPEPEKGAGLTKRSFSIVPLINGEPAGETHKVTQYHHTSWPDHGVPTANPAAIKLAELLARTDNTESPIVVHCSATVGRTGTTIAHAVGIATIGEEVVADPENFAANLTTQMVVDLRDERMTMVQTGDQFVFAGTQISNHLAANRVRVEATRGGAGESGKEFLMMNRLYNTIENRTHGSTPPPEEEDDLPPLPVVRQSPHLYANTLLAGVVTPKTEKDVTKFFLDTLGEKYGMWDGKTTRMNNVGSALMSASVEEIKDILNKLETYMTTYTIQLSGIQSEKKTTESGARATQLDRIQVAIAGVRQLLAEDSEI